MTFTGTDLMLAYFLSESLFLIFVLLWYRKDSNIGEGFKGAFIMSSILFIIFFLSLGFVSSINAPETNKSDACLSCFGNETQERSK